jgi:TolA-binding protein
MEMKLTDRKGEKMKRSKYLSVVVCVSFVAVLFLPGILKKAWGQEKEGKTAVEEKSTTKEKLSEEKAEYKDKVKEQLAELDKKIGELEAKIKESGSKIKADVKQDMKDLKKKRMALKKDMKKLEAKGREKWETAKQRVDAAIDEVEEAYHKILDKFKSE